MFNLNHFTKDSDLSIIWALSHHLKPGSTAQMLRIDILEVCRCVPQFLSLRCLSFLLYGLCKLYLLKVNNLGIRKITRKHKSAKPRLNKMTLDTPCVSDFRRCVQNTPSTCLSKYTFHDSYDIDVDVDKMAEVSRPNNITICRLQKSYSSSLETNEPPLSDCVGISALLKSTPQHTPNPPCNLPEGAEYNALEHERNYCVSSEPKRRRFKKIDKIRQITITRHKVNCERIVRAQQNHRDTSNFNGPCVGALSNILRSGLFTSAENDISRKDVSREYLRMQNASSPDPFEPSGFEIRSGSDVDIVGVNSPASYNKTPGEEYVAVEPFDIQMIDQLPFEQKQTTAIDISSCVHLPRERLLQNAVNLFLSEFISQEEPATFNQLLRKGMPRRNICTLFFGCLQSCRNGLVRMYQGKAFGMIFLLRGAEY